MVTAGYLELPPSHKLALIKICDSADSRSRVGYPGMDALRLWCGLSRSRVIAVINELEDLGLIVQVGRGNRGRRASYKAFPDPGDEALSVAARAGKQCPGAVNFKGLPPIPDDDEVAQRIATASAGRPFPGRRKGSYVQDPTETRSAPGKGPTGSTLSEAKGSYAQDPSEGGKGPAEDEKGSCFREKGSYTQDPFRTSLPKESLRDSSFVTADAVTEQDPAANEWDAGGLFGDLPAEDPQPTPKVRRKPRAKSPHADLARAITAAWYDALVTKPAGADTFRNVLKLVEGLLVGGWNPETQIRPAMDACGPAVTARALNYHLSQIEPATSAKLRPAQGNDSHWANGGGFGMPA
jgi:hypothetical protein